MNRLNDGTGWILPPRCASRFTAGLLWKYGMVQFREHACTDEAKVKRIIMNIRHPITRFCSFYRLFHGRSQVKMEFEEYCLNLSQPEHGVNFSNTVGEDIPPDEDWIYPIPMYKYIEILASRNQKVDHFVRFEHLEDDLAAAGYPVLTHKNDKVEYESPDERPEDWLFHHPNYLGLLMQIYGKDCEMFNYDLESLYATVY